MKVTMMALILAACATTASAYVANSADTNASSYDAQQTHQWTPVPTTPKAKTRAQVGQELVRAEKDGQLGGPEQALSGWLSEA